jgi:ArsR family transcriptional regulator
MRPVLQKSVEAFQQVDFSGLSRLEAINLVLGRSVEDTKWIDWRDQAEQLIFVPSGHIGPYTAAQFDSRAIYVFFGARLPEGTAVVVPELSRAEILVRLSALADDTRLSILKLVAEEGELRSGDIITLLNLSQSAASRHLQQLSATGLLRERRCQGAKCYQLNAQRIEDTLRAVATYLGVHIPPGAHLIDNYLQSGLAPQAMLTANSGNTFAWRGRMGGHHELV